MFEPIKNPINASWKIRAKIKERGEKKIDKTSPKYKGLRV